MAADAGTIVVIFITVDCEWVNDRCVCINGFQKDGIQRVFLGKAGTGPSPLALNLPQREGPRVEG